MSEGKHIRADVVPAQPGWMVVQPRYDQFGNLQSDFHRTPVVAWIVEVVEADPRNRDIDILVMAVTATGTVRNSRHALQFDGKPPFLNFTGEFANEAALRAAWRDRATAHPGASR